MNSKIVFEYCLNTDVLCVDSYLNFILAGIGNHIFVYENNKLILRKKIFIGEKIHSIFTYKDLIILKGGKEVACAYLKNQNNCFDICINVHVQCNDWIQDILYDQEKQYLVLATAHNVIKVWNIYTKKYLKSYACEEKCILYSCKIIGRSADDFLVLSGTVFSEIVIWSPFKTLGTNQPVLHRLKGHNGVIFSINIDCSRKLICTTSDDRSLRLWSVHTNDSLLKWRSWEDAAIFLTLTLYGHTARVWKSLILPEFVISAGEDSKICVWNIAGKIQNELLLHQETGIRSLTWKSDSGEVVTGGEDGGITLLTAEKLKWPSGVEVLFALPEMKGLPRKVCFAGDVTICVTDRGWILSSDAESFDHVIEEIEEFSNYCLVEISSCKRYLILGSVKGRLHVVNIKSGNVVFDDNVSNDKIFSLHWLDSHVVICTTNGKLNMYSVTYSTEMTLTLKKEFLLPNSKERWTTCALLYEDHLIVGDRMGSLHVYALQEPQEAPSRTFPKIHGHLGVRDIVEIENYILTSGRDGSVKQFRLIENAFINSMTFKLPMEWGWKIQKCRDDILVLGFNSVFFTVWSLKYRELLVKYDCGGGHRSFDYRIKDESMEIVYVRDKKVYFCRCLVSHSDRIRNGYHGKEINALKILQVDPLIVVSGSEDTTLRIARINEREIEELYVVETHISSVRDILVHHASDQEKIIFSAGGRAQISVHKISLNSLVYQECEKIFLQSYPKKGAEPSPDGETRIMCLDTIQLQKCIYLAAGCSDCQIRIFTFTDHLFQVASIAYTHCILKLKLVAVDAIVFLVSAGTDGKVNFWKFNYSGLDSIPKVKSLQVHQSGINSFQLKFVNNSKFVMATGGDDNLISVMLIEFNSENCLDIIDNWKNSAVHSCQITGIKLMGNVMLTSSVDQRLTIWMLKIRNNKIEMEFIDQYLTTVPDLQGMDVSFIDQFSLLVCLHGKGLEVVKVKLEKDVSSLKLEN